MKDDRDAAAFVARVVRHLVRPGDVGRGGQDEDHAMAHREVPEPGPVGRTQSKGPGGSQRDQHQGGVWYEPCSSGVPTRPHVFMVRVVPAHENPVEPMIERLLHPQRKGFERRREGWGGPRGWREGLEATKRLLPGCRADALGVQIPHVLECGRAGKHAGGEPSLEQKVLGIQLIAGKRSQSAAFVPLDALVLHGIGRILIVCSVSRREGPKKKVFLGPRSKGHRPRVAASAAASAAAVARPWGLHCGMAHASGSRSVLLYAGRAMQAHNPGEDHPERPERLAAIEHHLDRSRSGATWREPPAASRASLTQVHDARLVDRLFSLEGQTAVLDADTRMSPQSLYAARLAAGAAIASVDALIEGEAQRVFAMVRPPGHHATAQTSMGFCLFNNVAVAAQHARTHHGLERVLIVDWDVHHGNGTEAIFADDPNVLFFSTHQFPFYPGTGALHHQGRGEGLGRTVNVPLAAGATDADLRLAFTEILRPVADAFRPELVLVSAGFDAHRLDPLGQMAITEEGFADLCAEVVTIADAHAQGRMALLLEGGYDLEALGRSAVACVQVLEGSTPPDQRKPASRMGASAVAAARDAQRRYWPGILDR